MYKFLIMLYITILYSTLDTKGPVYPPFLPVYSDTGAYSIGVVHYLPSTTTCIMDESGP